MARQRRRGGRVFQGQAHAFVAGTRQRCAQGLGPVGTLVIADHDTRTGLGKPAHRRGADATAAASDDCDLT